MTAGTMLVRSTILFVLLTIGMSSAVDMVSPTLAIPSSFSALRQSGKSTLYKIELPETTPNSYPTAPLLLDLRGTRQQIGHDYAALLHNETLTVFNNFVSSVFPEYADQVLLSMFLDYCWER